MRVLEFSVGFGRPALEFKTSKVEKVRIAPIMTCGYVDSGEEAATFSEKFFCNISGVTVNMILAVSIFQLFGFGWFYGFILPLAVVICGGVVSCIALPFILIFGFLAEINRAIIACSSDPLHFWCCAAMIFVGVANLLFVISQLFPIGGSDGENILVNVLEEYFPKRTEAQDCELRSVKRFFLIGNLPFIFKTIRAACARRHK
jgi:Zn-dependent protease